MLTYFLNSFWSSDFWLPGNITWDDISNGTRNGITYPDYRDLIIAIVIGLLIIEFRKIYTKFFLKPFGKFLNIKDKVKKCSELKPGLELAYIKNKQLKNHKIIELIKQSDLTERQIQRWWRLRINYDKPTVLDKFCECGYRCTIYLFLFLFGLIINWNRDYFWDFDKMWIGYPHINLDNILWCHVMLTMGLYVSVAITQFTDVRRKDFWQMIIHHILVLILIPLMFIINLNYIISVLATIHDIADVILELGKCCKYANLKKFLNPLFVIFVFVWIVTRNLMFGRLYYSCIIKSFNYIPTNWPAYKFIITIFSSFLFLHVLWTFLILRMIIRVLKVGEVCKL